MALVLHLPSHPTEDALEDYVLLRLPETEVASLEEHLFACAACTESLEKVDEIIVSLRLVHSHNPARLDPFEQSWWERLREGVAGRFTIANAGWVAITAICLALLIPGWRSGNPTSPAQVKLASFRGNGGLHVAHAAARKPLDLTIDAPDLPANRSYRLEVVTATGQLAWSGPLQGIDGKSSTRVSTQLAAGTYWVRLYAQDAELLREFNLRLE